MTDFTATFEAGVNGATIATTDPGAATAWDLVNGAPVYSNTHASHGTLSGKIPAFDDWLRWSLPNVTDNYGRIYLYATVFPGTETVILACGRTTAPTHSFQITVRTDGALRIRDAIGTNTFGSVPIALNQWVRIEYFFHIEEDPNGVVEARLFNDAASTTPDETIGGVGQATGTFPFEYATFGTIVFGAWGADYWLDDIVANATNWVGPVLGPPQVLSMQTHVFGHGVW